MLGPWPVRALADVSQRLRNENLIAICRIAPKFGIGPQKNFLKVTFGWCRYGDEIRRHALLRPKSVEKVTDPIRRTE